MRLRRGPIRRRAIRLGLLASNLVVLAVILVFVLQNSHSAAGLTTPSALDTASNAAVANPLDQVSSADIALTVARVSSLPETTAITNQAQSQAADIALAASTDNVTSKPEVVATALKSRADIQTYTTQAGDTVSSVAAKFGVTSDSVLWSNGLSNVNVAAGTKLTIPPVNGLVYTVKAGDTPQSLATQFKANQNQIVAYNDSELSGLQTGEQIIIPGGTQTIAAPPVYGAAAGGGSTGSSASFPWGNGPMYGFNGYDYGYCTWYVATQVGVPGNWGNASTWAYYARQSGWNVSSTPTIGSIAQKGGGEGHVAIVTGVNPDGTVEVRDMNGFAGWGRVGTGTVSAGTFQNYITQ
jgi:surface antigen